MITVLNTTGFGQGFGQREENTKLKPITEYKAIGELTSLGKDKTMYRDWNIKLKDALEQIYRDKEFIEIMDYIDHASIVINGDSKVKEIMDSAEEDAILIKEEEWHKLAGHLKSILLQKCEEKPAAFLKVRRSNN